MMLCCTTAVAPVFSHLFCIAASHIPVFFIIVGNITVVSFVHDSFYSTTTRWQFVSAYDCPSLLLLSLLLLPLLLLPLLLLPLLLLTLLAHFAHKALERFSTDAADTENDPAKEAMFDEKVSTSALARSHCPHRPCSIHGLYTTLIAVFSTVHGLLYLI